MERYISLQEEAYSFIKEQVLSGAYETDKMYSIKTVADELKMSKTPVRDAIYKLSQEDFLDIFPSRGFRLHVRTKKEIVELYQLRCAIEGYWCSNMAISVSGKNNYRELELMNENLKQQEALIAAGKGPREFLIVDVEFHNIIASATGNSMMNDIITDNRYKIDDFSFRSLEMPGMLTITMAEHRAIYDAIRSGDPSASRDAMVTHLNTPLEKNLNRLMPQ